MQMQALSAAASAFDGISKPVWGQIRLKSLYTPATDPSSDSMAGSAGTGPKWAQKTVTLPPLRRGCHLVTPNIIKEIGQDLSGFKVGLAHLFRPDDMPADIKSSMFGCTLTIPITDGRFNMGTWQGIWLCEHRDSPTARKVVVTLNGV